MDKKEIKTSSQVDEQSSINDDKCQQVIDEIKQTMKSADLTVPEIMTVIAFLAHSMSRTVSFGEAMGILQPGASENWRTVLTSEGRVEE